MVERGPLAAVQQLQEFGREILLPGAEGADDTGVGDEAGEAVLAGGGADGQVAAEALPDQGDPPLVDLGPPAQEVDDRGDHPLPVGDEGLVAEEEVGALARPFEDQRVPAPFQRCGATVHVRGARTNSWR